MERPAKRARLIDDGDSEEDFSDTNSSPNLKINEEYAKRFEHNKKREERQKLEEKYGKKQHSDESDSDSESESEDEGDLATADVDSQIRDVLQAIRSKDQRVYDKNHNFYDIKANVAIADGTEKEFKPKTVHLRDYHRDNLLAGSREGESEQNGDQKSRNEVSATYNNEQAAIKRELVAQANAGGESEDDSDEDFMVAKSRPEPSKKKEDFHFDPQTADANPDAFLLDFVTSANWKTSDSGAPHLDPFESEDSDEEDRADAYEDAYNMRFEDPARANEKLISHSRDAAAKYSARREEKTGRAKARERERSQKEAEKRGRQVEKNRLRNLRLEEAQEKLRRFKHAAGIRSQEISEHEWSKFLDAGFDENKWEQEMQRRFGEEYYAEDDDQMSVEGEAEHEPLSGRKKHAKPKWDDDIDIGDLIPDFEEDVQADVKLTDDEADTGGIGGANEGTGDSNDVESQASLNQKPGLKRTKAERAEAKRAQRLERRKLEALVDQQLLEDAAVPSSSSNGAPFFRYRETSPQNFGLDAKTILMADDAQLNQWVGLKKYAAFRPDDKKTKDRKRLSKKDRLKKWKRETFGNKDGPQVDWNEWLSQKGAGSNANGATGDVDVGEIKDKANGDSSNKKRRRAKKKAITGGA